MYLEVFIANSPVGVGQSYPPLGYANYGVVCWEYANGYRGPVHWINWKKCRVEPEYANPQAYWYWFHPGTEAVITPKPTIRTDVADAYINGVAVNLLTGKGLPFVP